VGCRRGWCNFGFGSDDGITWFYPEELAPAKETNSELKWLDEIELRAALATQGPWVADIRVGAIAVYPKYVGPVNCFDDAKQNFVYYKPGEQDDDGNWYTSFQDEKDAEFIANARTDVPKLCGVIRGLVSALEKYADRRNWNSNACSVGPELAESVLEQVKRGEI